MPLPDIDFKELSKNMLSAAQAVIPKYAGDIKTMAEGEFKDFAQRTAELSDKVAKGLITPSQAKLILKIRQNSLETVMLSIAGISIVAAQEAINAVLGVLKDVINTAIPGVNLLN